MATADFSVVDLVRAMDSASEDIKRQMARLIEQSADTLVGRVTRAYPVGPTGTLRERVYATQPRSFSTVSGSNVPAKIVRATAPHVHIYQEGTVERFDPTRGNARRGRSPRHGRIFERNAAQVRAEMVREAQRILDTPRDLTGPVASLGRFL